MAINILDDHDRIVDDEADRKRKPAESHDVERLMENVRGEKRAEHRDRERDRDDECRAPRVQEEQDDQNREHGAVDGRMFERIDRIGDEAALIEENAESHRGVAMLQIGNFRIHALRDGDDVGIRLRGDDQRHTRLAVEAREDALLLDAVPHGCHVAQVDRSAILDRDDGVADFGGALIKRARADAVFIRADRNNAGGRIDVLGFNLVDDRGTRQTVAREYRGIRLDVDRTRLSAGDADAADTGDGREFVGDLIAEQIREIAQRPHGVGDLNADDG